MMDTQGTMSKMITGKTRALNCGLLEGRQRSVHVLLVLSIKVLFLTAPRPYCIRFFPGTARCVRRVVCNSSSSVTGTAACYCFLMFPPLCQLSSSQVVLLKVREKVLCFF